MQPRMSTATSLSLSLGVLLLWVLLGECAKNEIGLWELFVDIRLVVIITLKCTGWHRGKISWCHLWIFDSFIHYIYIILTRLLIYPYKFTHTITKCIFFLFVESLYLNHYVISTRICTNIPPNQALPSFPPLFIFCQSNKGSFHCCDFVKWLFRKKWLSLFWFTVLSFPSRQITA